MTTTEATMPVCSAGHINQRQMFECRPCRQSLADELGVTLARVETEMDYCDNQQGAHNG